MILPCPSEKEDKRVKNDRSGKNNPNWKGGLKEISCNFCALVFFLKPSQIKNDNGNSCSRSCAASIQFIKNKKEYFESIRLHCSCKNCGSVFTIRRSREGKEGKFCSMPCRSAYIIENETQKGKNNNRYSHGQSRYSRFYSAQRRAAGGAYTKEDIEEMIKKQKFKCANCLVKIKGSNYHVDHVMPIKLGGTNHLYNLQVLCPPCNLKKSAKDPIVWANENGRLL
jgi:5-methylcytosine-specific restriction endonuclease McrA